MTNFGTDATFILLAKKLAKEDKFSEYLEFANQTDKAVKPGMLHDTFDQNQENPLIFVRSEAYKNDDAFIANLSNPAIGEYLQ